MRHGAGLVTLAACVVAAAVAASDDAAKLPEKLAGYRSWAMTTAEPHIVPPEAAAACAPSSAFLDDEEKYGPHASRWLKVYVNETAAAAMRNREDLTAYPEGSIIAKEKLVHPTAEDAEGVAFMIKDGERWEFLYYPSTGKAGEYDGCVSCHRGARRDSVFATFEREPPDD